MSATNLSGPLAVGPVSPTGQPSAKGGAVLCQKYVLDVTAVTPGTGVDAFRLPDGSEIVDMDVVIKTTSNAVTTGTLALANAAGDIVTGFDVKSAANTLLSLAGGDAAVADAGRLLDPASGDTNLQLVYAETGTAATAGEFHVRVYYI